MRWSVLQGCSSWVTEPEFKFKQKVSRVHGCNHQVRAPLCREKGMNEKMKETSSHTKTPSSLKRKPTCSPKESTKNTKNPGNRHAHRQSLNRMCWKVLWDFQRFHKLWFLTLVLLQLSLLKWNHLLLQFAVWAPFLQIIEVIVSCDQIPLLQRWEIIRNGTVRPMRRKGTKQRQLACRKTCKWVAERK